MGPRWRHLQQEGTAVTKGTYSSLDLEPRSGPQGSGCATVTTTGEAQGWVLTMWPCTGHLSTLGKASLVSPNSSSVSSVYFAVTAESRL